MLSLEKTDMRNLFLLLAMLTGSVCWSQKLSDNYPKMVNQIIKSLDPKPDESVIIRYDPELMADLALGLATVMKPKVETLIILPYGPMENFSVSLSETAIYIMLPVRSVVPGQPEQDRALVEWLDSGGGRQIHFHWGDGTRNWDSTNGQHNAVYDSIYLAALDIDYEALDRKQERVAEILRSGLIGVTTPAGTDLTFQISNRTITKQNGDASLERMKSAKVRIEREIELPSGAIRVSPIEESVNGTLVVGTGNIAGVEVADLQLIFEKGKVVNVEATKGKSAFEAKLESTPGLNYFREIGIGFNPALNKPKGFDPVPYYGYGQGVVRLSLGNNIELGGKVGEHGVQWMFFLDTTVKVGDVVIVKDGVLQEL